jgi:hypothetical protein
MKTYIKTNWFLILTVLILASMLFVKCENEKLLTGNLDTLHVQMQSYKLKDGRLVNTSKTVTYNKVPNKTDLTKQFAKVNTIIKVVEKVRIDTVNIVYHDTITMPFERKGTVLTDDYSLDYKSTHKGLSIANLTVNDSLEIVTGTKRKWFLGREVNTIDVAHSNKHIESTGLQHIEIKRKKKFYETTLFQIGVGILIGTQIK